MKILNNPLFQLTLIIVCAILFNLLPYFISGVPLHQQILSDAEAHISIWQLGLNPHFYAEDKILKSMVETLPTGQRVSNWFIGYFARSFKLDLFQLSVFLSFCVLVLYLCGIYLLTLLSLKEKLLAFLITLWSIIPIHALGGSVLGIQALGFLPRDLALSIVIYILVLYLYANERASKNYIKLAFFITGLFVNIYPPLFFQFFITILFAELIRIRKIDSSILWYSGLSLLGAMPAAFDILMKNVQTVPIDIEITRSFYKYMIASISWDTIRYYLRRFLFYSLLIPVMYYLSIRKVSETERKNLRPWMAIAMSSFLLALLGVYLESTTRFIKYLISRTSLWFMLSSMVICAYGFRFIFRRYAVPKATLLSIMAISIIFLFQSNLPTTARFLRDVYKNREQTKAFHAAISKLKEETHEEVIILAPSEEFYDLAASVRTYSFRSIYVCYKYGGVSVMDGAIAREWFERYRKITEVFKNRDPQILINFMRDEKIQYAFLPSSYYSRENPLIKNYIVIDTGYFLIIKI